MCTRPIKIPNPSYRRTTYASELGAIVDVPRHLVPSQEYIDVPCGKCAECRASYFNSVLQRGIVESLTSYVYFVTLTYDNEHLPVINLPNGKDVYYCDYSDLQNLFKRFRRHEVLDRQFRYVAALEYGDTYSRPHFHLLIYVSKLVDDSPSTPYIIERQLFDSLKKYFAVNVGSLRSPIYEPLFTYTTRVTSKGIKSNYFVQYIEPNSSEVYSTEIVQDSNYIKSLRYLIGYVNKGSAFDDTIEQYLYTISDDLLRNKLRTLLRSKFRYSKGFGFGFDTTTGEKIYLPRISVRASGNTLIYSNYIKELPSTYDEFEMSYPDLHDSLRFFISECKYLKYSSLQEALSNFSTTDYLCHVVLLKYFPNYFDKIYKCHFRDRNIATISYYFNYDISYHYTKAKVYTSSPVDSFTYRYLRKGVDDALRAGVPYFSFPLQSAGKYSALCKFYKDRICTIYDYITLYNNCGVSDYEDWQSLFVKQLSIYQANKAISNKFTHLPEKICKYQKQFIYLPRRLEGIALFRYVFDRVG